jgi:hypothetical protein
MSKDTLLTEYLPWGERIGVRIRREEDNHLQVG